MGGLDENGPPPFKRVKLSTEFASEEPYPAAGLPGIAMARTYPKPSSSSPSSTAAAGSSSSSLSSSSSSPRDAEAMLGPNGLIRRVELVRVITQSLYSLGFMKAAALLEDESGIPFQSQVVSSFRQFVLDGKWDDSVAALRNLGLLDYHSFNSAASLILQQKFLELLRQGDTSEALKALRSEISPLQIEKERLHDLASCLICPARVELLSDIQEKHPRLSPRLQLLERLQGILPPFIMMPERRLEHLLEQALNVQRKVCIYHNSLDQPLSLFSDHRCGRDQLPTKTHQVLVGHENEVWFLQFSHNGRFLASASKDRTAKIWEVVGEDFVKLKCTLTGHQKPVSFVAWSPDDRMILTCGNEEVMKLWDAESEECKHTFDKPSCTACAWFPDGKRFISGGGDKCIYMWDVTGKELDSWKGVRVPRIHDLTVTADGIHMISICEKDIRIYNLDTKVERVINEDKPITSLSVSKDGRFLLVNLVSQEIHLWDIADIFKLLLKYKGHRHTHYVIRSCFGGSNQAFIVSGSEDSQVYIWHRGKGELLEVLPGHSGTVNCVSWNPVNPHMFASASDDHTIRIWGLNKLACNLKVSSTSNGVVHLVNGGPVPSY